MAGKPSTPPVPIPKTFSLEEINRAIPQLQRRIEQVDKLKEENVNYGDQKVTNVESAIRNAILVIFGPHSPEYKEHQYHSIWQGGHWVGMTPEERQHNFNEGIPQTITMLNGLIERLEERRIDLKLSHQPSQTMNIAIKDRNLNIFIVHGRNDGAKEKVARFVQNLGLNPIVLHEQPNQGRTLIEKFEHHSNVGYAIILLTADDKGCLKEKAENQSGWMDRPRQNVVFEFGYFAGKLTRMNVCAIFDKEIEIPSDLDGLVYIPWDDSNNWKMELVKELRAAGYAVDANKAFE